MGKSANLASGDRLSSTPGDRINTRDLSDRAIDSHPHHAIESISANYPIGQFIRSGNLSDRAIDKFAVVISFPVAPAT
ncbi:hypothetical protein QUA54_11750 [Microcoleus sp. MOSTC5]|uniref:hypothetical protein n=1 Tax=Microcoleus sp. MOSTC5 TaxID=3055378 RepID=UPI002FD09436